MGIDSATFTFCLKSCVELDSLLFGRGIHADAFKLGLSSCKFVASSLIALYSKCGGIDDARQVFDEVTERDLVLFTSMISGYAQTRDLHAHGAFEVAQCMQMEGFIPNRVTLVSLLQAAAQLEALIEGQSVHGYAMRRDIGLQDEVFRTSLADMYVKCGAPDMAAHAFGRMGAQTVGLSNVTISGHLHMGRPLEALGCFRSLVVKENIMPDSITLANGIFSCVDAKCFREGMSIHGYVIRNGIRLDLIAKTALIDMYSKCNDLFKARGVFDRMEERDVISYNVMMAGYLQNGFIFEVMDIFFKLGVIDIRPNQASVLTMLSAISDLKDLRLGGAAHGFVLRSGLASVTEIANQVIQMYARCGCIDFAKRVFRGIKSKDLVSWTSMMTSCVNHGSADEAVALFILMNRDNQKPDSITILSLLQALSQLGCLDLAKEVHCCAYRVFLGTDIQIINSLISSYAKCGKLRIATKLFEHTTGQCLASWNALIAAYGMHGKPKEALKLFERMENENVVPDGVTFTSLLSACSHSGLVEEGLCVFRSMTEKYTMVPCEEHYSCMVDMLSRAGWIEEAFDLMKSLPPSKSTSALGALLGACRVHGSTEMGKVIGEELLNLEPANSSAYTSISNLYAEDANWDEVARVRGLAAGRGLKTNPGYSLIELGKGSGLV